MLEAIDPAMKKRKELRSKSEAILKRLDRRSLRLTSHEEIIASEIIWPEDLKVTFKDIAGLDSIIESLRETVIYPLCYPQVFESVSGILGPPKGVLLYGPPGCGKTMLAKALAKESGATFINLHISTLTEKWFGESQKLVSGLFSLAKKLQPTIIFIDEIDSFLRMRKSDDHEATSMMKAEFMTLWDGLVSGEAASVIVLGATNRPLDLDKAILRRMPKRFAIKLPSFVQRQAVLKTLLKRVNLSPSFDYARLAEKTEGYSCSDLKELCRAACMLPVREAFKVIRSKLPNDDVSVNDLHALDGFVVRQVTLNDFFGEDSNLNDSGFVEMEPLD